ncbi:MAG: LPS export ABC transporter periplasmic protein LptC [Bacteroidetes bacterium]|nr:LPS export ABC transporter periplasmic protein LptC [Bacteroidota bacterium]
MIKKSPKSLKGLFAFLISGKERLLFLLPLGLGLHSCHTDIKTVIQLDSGKNLPSESMKDAEIMYSDSGTVKMKLTAVQLDRYVGEKEYIEMPRGMNILFYDDSMQVNAQLKADYGIRYEKEGKMEAKRNVEVVNVKGEKLNTEHLYWDENKKLIYTNNFVKLTTKEEVIYGDGLEANEDFSKYKIMNIKGQFNLKDKESTDTKE